jgi:hypothetical protein
MTPGLLRVASPLITKKRKKEMMMMLGACKTVDYPDLHRVPHMWTVCEAQTMKREIDNFSISFQLVKIFFKRSCCG